MKTTQHINKEDGFTLVELAIVMIIIGLLTGGILKGQEMIENAKVTATISQVKSVQAALNAFRDTYSAMPGDMANAHQRVPNCVLNTTDCRSGDGNGLIATGSGAATNKPWDWPSVAADLETQLVWKHMVLANLISSIPADAPVDGAVNNDGWGATHPASAMRGGYELYYDADMTDINGSVSGHFIRWSNQGVAGTSTKTIGGTGTSPVSPLRAAQIDRKLDDGRPTTGSTLASGTGTTCVDTGNYNGTEEQKNCVMFFLIDG